MPLVKLKKCKACESTTWHELVDCGPPGPSYWRCRDCGERRAAKRVVLSDDYALHRGHVQTRNHAAQVHVLDINVLGARLRFVAEDGFPVARSDTILFNADLQPVGPLGIFHLATVRWVKDAEFGISFNTPLLASAADLACVVRG